MAILETPTKKIVAPSMGERKRKPLTNLYIMLWVLSNEFDNLLGGFFLGGKNQRWVAISVV